MADYTNWIDKDVYDKDDNKVGTIDALYLDSDNSEPAWATVKSSGFFGSKLHFAPLARATETDDGIKFDVTKDQINDAPSVEADEELSDEDEGLLFQHYAGHSHESETASDDVTDDDIEDESGVQDSSGPNTDDAMTRSEEELHVGKETQVAGKARLRKYIVTENVQTTVPVSHEEVEIVSEPITDANRDQAMSGGDLTEEQAEVELTEERVVVSKETVPKERVKLGTKTVTEDAQVNETIRKEQIDSETTQQ